jgi:hypothetical protein
VIVIRKKKAEKIAHFLSESRRHRAKYASFCVFSAPMKRYNLEEHWRCAWVDLSSIIVPDQSSMRDTPPAAPGGRFT